MTESITQPEPTPQPEGGEDRNALIRQAYATATKQLREAHLDEFRQLQQAEAQRLGVTDWTPKPTADEKAEAQLAALLAENPALKQRITDEVKAQIAESG
jgi:hypothetical protein